MKCINKDTGSLKVGAEGDELLNVGDQIKVNDKLYTLTYKMGRGEKCCVCAKGCGAFPQGEVDWEKVS